MYCATLSYGVMVYGVVNRRRRMRHAAAMGTAITIDLALVLVLEFQRHAVETAMRFSLSPLQQTHIAVSTVATLLYIPMLTLGIAGYYQGMRGKRRLWHKRLGIATFVFRTLGFLFMFSMLSHVNR